MERAAPRRSDTDLLQRRLPLWLAAGIVTPDQAESILRFESARTAPEERRLPIATEVAVYLGSVLALMGGAVLAAQRWEDLALPARIALAVAVAAVGYLAGAWLVGIGEVGTDRLASFMWVVGTGGVALLLGTVMVELDPAREAWSAVVVGVAVLGSGLGLWRNREERALQLVTAAVGAMVAAGGLTELSGAPVWALGLVLWLAAVVAAGPVHRGLVRPRLVALVLVAGGAMVGAGMLAELNEHLGPAAAAATAAAVVIVALTDRDRVLLAIGVIGFLIATQALLATTFTGLAASVGVTAAGLAIVVVALVRSLRTGTGRGVLS